MGKLPCIALIMLFLCVSAPGWGQESGKNVLRLSISNDESTVVDRIVYYALHSMGYEGFFEAMGMSAAIATANSGEKDGITAQAPGLERKFPNLVMVPEEVCVVKFEAYAPKGSGLNISSWEQLGGLRVGTVHQKSYIHSKLPANIASLIRKENVPFLIQALEDGECDVIVMSNSLLTDVLVPPTLEKVGEVDRVKGYPYLNRKYAYLVPALTQALAAMRADGTYDKLSRQEPLSVDDRKVVLHLSSFYRDLAWEQQLDEGVESVLAAPGNVDIHTVSLDSSRIHDEDDRAKSIFTALRASILRRLPDVIIASGDNAMAFILSYYSRMFTKIPIVFCGVSAFNKDDMWKTENLATAIVDIPSAAETVQLMLTMFPSTQNIFVINDYMETGTFWREAIARQLEPISKRVEIFYSQKQTLPELLETIKSLPPNTLILSGFYHVDGAGVAYSIKSLQTRLAQAAGSIPIFGLMDTSIGYGQLGGKYTNANQQGQWAAQTALALLEGRQRDALQENSSNRHQWIFDYRELQRWGIEDKLLPAASLVINRPISFRETNPAAFSLFVALIAASVATAVILIIFISILSKRNRQLINAQKNLHTAEYLRDSMRKAQDELQQLIDSMPIPIYLVNLRSMGLVYANKSFLEFFGFASTQEALTYSLEKLNAPVQEGGELATTAMFREINNIVNGHLQFRNWIFMALNGKEIHAQLVASIIDYNGERCLVIGIQDLEAETQRERLLLEAARKEREANKMKSLFLMNMSHEIRTPMNAVIGFSQLAQQRDLDSETLDTFYKINLSATALLGIINDILDFSKIEAEKLDLLSETFMLEDVMGNAFVVASGRIQDKPIDMFMDIAPDVPGLLIGDRTRLWQVLKNLLDNSAKYTESGHITLRTEVVEASPSRVVLRFVVSDSGLGMNEDQLARLFVPFEQFHHKKSQQSGTGLGMSITKQLVELMGGGISFTSQVKQGTVGTVILPFGLDPASITLQQYAKEYTLKGQRILLVAENLQLENNILNLMSLTDMDAIEIVSGEQAMERVRMRQNQPFSIIIIDSGMQQVESLDLARQFKAEKVSARLFLLVATHKRQSLALNGDDVNWLKIIEKPFSPTSLWKELDNSPSNPARKPSTRVYAPLSRARVLLCEDNVLNQAVARGMLATFGIKPVVAKHGQEGLDALRRQEFDLVLMDIMMPVMDGIEATRIIRSSGQPFSNIPIIAMTANIMKEDLERYAQEGIDDSLGKPMSIEQLYNILVKYLPPGLLQQS